MQKKQEEMERNKNKSKKQKETGRTEWKKQNMKKQNFQPSLDCSSLLQYITA